MGKPLLRKTSEHVRGASPPSSLGEVASRWNTVRFGRALRHVEKTTSTNDVAWAWVGEGAREGSVVVADSQTAGRGRRGRRWDSPPGKGVYLSVILYPDAFPPELGVLSLGMAVAVADACAEVCDIPVETKWPNDILVTGRKLGGILIETRLSRGRVRAAVVGIGVNVSLTQAEAPPELRGRVTSLLQENCDGVTVREVLCAVLRQAETRYAQFQRGGRETLLDDYRRRERCLGRLVHVQAGGKSVTGVAESLGSAGELFVRTEAGDLHSFAVGEVTLREASSCRETKRVERPRQE